MSAVMVAICLIISGGGLVSAVMVAICLIISGGRDDGHMSDH